MIERVRSIAYGERSTVFVDRTSGKPYLYLAGGFEWPSDEPGYAVVVGVIKDDQDGILISCLDEIEDIQINRLIEKMNIMQTRWGSEFDELKWFWAGNPVNPQKMYAGWISNLVTIRPAYGVQDETNSGLFLNNTGILRDMMFKSGWKPFTLITADCTTIQGHLAEFDKGEAQKGTPAKYPAISGLGHIVASLIHYKPWKHMLQASAYRRKLGTSRVNDLGERI